MSCSVLFQVHISSIRHKGLAAVEKCFGLASYYGWRAASWSQESPFWWIQLTFGYGYARLLSKGSFAVNYPISYDENGEPGEGQRPTGLPLLVLPRIREAVGRYILVLSCGHLIQEMVGWTSSGQPRDVDPLGSYHRIWLTLKGSDKGWYETYDCNIVTRSHRILNSISHRPIYVFDRVLGWFPSRNSWMEMRWVREIFQAVSLFNETKR